MNSAELRTTLNEWLDELKTWSPGSDQSWDDYILTDEDWARYVGGKKTDYGRNGVHLNMIFWTTEHCYHISATAPSGTKPTGYLGAYVHCRRQRAGENWTRGSDLPDGPFSKEMWETILKSIIGYEIVAASRRGLDAIKGKGTSAPVVDDITNG